MSCKPHLAACARCPEIRSKPGYIYSLDNRSILDKQLLETYGETIADLNHATTNSRKWTITLRKVNIPPLVVRKIIRTVARIEKAATQLHLDTPQPEVGPALPKTTYRLSEQPGIYKVLQQVGETVIIESQQETVDLFAASVDLAANYHLDVLTLYTQLKNIYPETSAMPISHLTKLAEQIEDQTRNYEVREESVEVALALIKPDGFDKEIAADGMETYTAEISYPIDREQLLTRWEKWKDQAGELGFHYDPYNFDSSPERSFFTQLLDTLNQQPDQVEDIYFTGALSDPQKTDFFVEYKGEDNNWHRYTPDFVIRRKDGKCLIVEIKKEHDRLHIIDGENGAKAIATQKWVGLNPDKLKYQMIFTANDEIGYDQVYKAAAIIRRQRIMNNKTSEVHIKPAKGRPMLTWVGKRPLRTVTSYPAQKIEVFGSTNKASDKQADIWADWPADYPQGGLLFHGDNKDVLAHLLAEGFRGKIQLIYIDPPFDSGADYVRKVVLRGMVGMAKIEGEEYALGEQIQYTDIWAKDSYIQFIYERLLMLKELLSENGCIYVHCDYRKGHYIRCLLDEIFGSENLQNEIIWKRTSARSDLHTFNHIHDSIYFYSKSKEIYFNQLHVPHTKEYIKRYFTYKEPDGRRFATIDATQAGITKTGESGKPWRGFDPASKGNHWKFGISEMDRLDDEGKIYWPDKEGGWPRLKAYLKEQKGAAIQSIWNDVNVINSQANEREEYPTQKPEALLERIIGSSSRPGDLILDCFIGSGTTAAVAQKMGRRWIGCDINKGAIQTASKRLSDILKDQVSTVQAPKSPKLLPIDDGQEEQPKPIQLSFSVFRVNDYDLQIQHNEAVNLACKHIGITRTKTDTFFEGVLGKRLAKIVPFNHPASPLDLEEIKRELGNRPEEGRDIVVVCLGKELAIDAWIEDWNRLRMQGDFPNKIEVIELRSDPRYGGFFTHQPAQADIKIQRTGERISVDIESFVSPTIVERLKQQAGLLSPQIDDWRAMVDSVMIDPAYDGKVFNVALADVPEKKSDLVAGKYSLPLRDKKTTVAVKITDMLGEEVLNTQQV